MSAVRPVTSVRAKDLAPGMKVERIDADLDFVYVEIDKIEPVRRTYATGSPERLVSYKVYLVGYAQGAGQDSSLRPFTIRTSQRINVLQEN